MGFNSGFKGLKDNANGNNHHTEDGIKESIWDAVPSAYH